MKVRVTGVLCQSESEPATLVTGGVTSAPGSGGVPLLKLKVVPPQTPHGYDAERPRNGSHHTAESQVL